MESLVHALSLRNVSGVGSVLYKRLIETFQTAESVFSTDAEALSEVEGVSESAIQNILTFHDFDSAKREIEKIEKEGVTVLTLNDPAYPKLLLDIYDPPPILYRKGNISDATEHDPYPIAMVGTRNMTAYGKSVAQWTACELAKVGVTVVSGFARGIDAISHQTAIASGGRTFAVLGCGIDVLYPKEHRKLYDDILEHGFIFSEFPMGTIPEPRNFPKRNRIISGLSLGTIIVEAAQKSGSLITARLALEQGREVFAVPGSIFSETSKGVHDLIQSGAKLVQAIDDILRELLPQMRAAHPALPNAGKESFFRPVTLQEPVKEKKNLPEMTPQEKIIYDLLSKEPKQINTIIEASALTSAMVSYYLLELELKGVVRQMTGQFYVRL
ncbi:MAG: DNA-processing protein DprA [Nitrospirota bacterium]